MMIQQQASVPAGMDHKKELLHAVYGVYSRWVERFPLACQKGCAACCTQSVTMTSLEGVEVLGFIKRKGMEKWLIEKLGKTTAGKSKAAITTNQYAKACLEHQEVDEETLGNWDLTPCVFLEKNICSIYEARPFGCRSFGSLTRCSDRSAEIAPIHLTVNTVFAQIVEHFVSDGGYWGNMADILGNLIENQVSGSTRILLPAQPIPGFLLEPYEVKLIHVLLKQLYEQSAEKQTFGDLIDNFMPI